MRRAIANNLFPQFIGQLRQRANLRFATWAWLGAGGLQEVLKLLQLSLGVEKLVFVLKAHRAISTTPLPTPLRSVPKNR